MFYELARGLEITHFGTIRGSNRWENFDAVVVLGREQVPEEGVLKQARQLYGDTDIQFDIPDPLRYVWASRPYSPTAGAIAKIDAFRDPRLQALVELTRERGTGQAIDRLRLMYEKQGRSPEVYLLCDIPIEGIVPDVLASMNDIAHGGSRIERAFAAGPISTNPGFLLHRHRGRWVTESAAEIDLRRAQVTEIAKKLSTEENRQNANNILLASRRFSPSRPIAVKFRRLTSNRAKFSTLIWSPRTPGHERPDLQIAEFFGVTDMAEIEFSGDGAVAVMAERDQDEAADEIATLTKAPGDPDPTAVESAGFIAAALKFYEAIERCRDVPPPKWWTDAIPAPDMPALVPPGRRFHVWYRCNGEWQHVWFFGAEGIFTDHEFRPIEVADEVRLEAERIARGCADAGEKVEA